MKPPSTVPNNQDETMLHARLAELEQTLAVEQKRSAFLERLLGTINDAVIVVDKSQSVQEWNAAAERTYGWTAQEANGQNLQTLVKTRFLDPISGADALTRLYTEDVWRELVVQHHRDGHELWIESAVRLLRDTTGTVIGFVGVNRDVTARWQAEAALRQSEATLRAFFDTTSEAHFLLDTHYRVLAFNRVMAQEAQRMWQWRITEGDDARDFMPSSVFSSYYQRCIDGESIRHERSLTYDSGENIWYELAYNPVKDQEGHVVGVAISGHNITARKEAEAALAQREAQLAGIIDSAMDAIITLDAEHKIVLFNRTAEQVFGCTALDVIGQTIDRFIVFESRLIHEQHITAFGTKKATRRSMAHPSIVDAVRADGSRFPIEATISQIDVAGKHFFTVILRDISERKQLEARLIQAQRLESVGRLAGGIAHDFNNMLTTIGGAAQLVQIALPPNHSVQRDLDNILETVQRSAALSGRLLAFARQQVLAPGVIDLNQLLHGIEPLLQRLLGVQVTLQTHLAAQIAPIMADAIQLEQVIMNLAVNARDAMPGGGTFVITTENIMLELPVEATDTLPQPKQYARIAVQDSGEGITDSVLPYIFEPFFTTKAVGKGTGLGLSTTYGIVVQHGGTIHVSSASGRGTLFTIDLPAIPDDNAA